MKSSPILAERDKCTGCGACFAICRHDAISMRSDDEGFVRPFIDEAKCVKCHLCKDVCPVLGMCVRNESCIAYAAKAKDENVRLASTSGGVFTLLAKSVLDKGGVVYGVAFDAVSGKVVYRRADTLEQAAAFRGSKYVQADVSKSLREIKDVLQKAGRWVLFSGTPCQIAGIKSYLQMLKVDMERLFLVEVICHAASSPLAWEKYLNQFDGGIAKVDFRSKRRGWRKYTMSLVDSSGKERLSHFRGYTYLWGFLQSLYNRPSCHVCHFRRGGSGADISIGDFWGIESVAPEMDDNRGVSSVIVRTSKGGLLWDRIRESADFKVASYQAMLQGNPALTESPVPHQRRKEFFSMMLSGRTFDSAVKELLQMTLRDRVARWIGCLK